MNNLHCQFNVMFHKFSFVTTNSSQQVLYAAHGHQRCNEEEGSSMLHQKTSGIEKLWVLAHVRIILQLLNQSQTDKLSMSVQAWKKLRNALHVEGAVWKA